ncbi:MAG: aspartate-semialdehyde dehydrogenase [Acidobacteriia bacterium]|nr:aspartate-semialdehyde dehydrogenase [Terriglobia bacterium]
MAEDHKYRVGILGATGMVGQWFIRLLESHPQFTVTALAASDRSQGKTYGEACAWRLPGGMPSYARLMVIHPPHPPLDCEIIFSSLPADVAKKSEAAFAEAGYPVISNSSAFRMDPAVPLLIPEVNPDHLGLLELQLQSPGSNGGYLVTNPNCSTIVLTLALAPLQRTFGLEAVAATTLQAISGAGYPGVASLDITDNVLPFIEHEEEKIQRETKKILGVYKGEKVEDAPMPVSAQCHRVNVSDGHTVAVRVKLSRPAKPVEVREAFETFTGVPQSMGLHSAPSHPLIVRDEPDRPQPRLDRDAGRGMSVTIGRIAQDPVLDYRFVALGHNVVRGAAGAAILNGELLIATGWLSKEKRMRNSLADSSR